jgi:hypothetical protein
MPLVTPMRFRRILTRTGIFEPKMHGFRALTRARVGVSPSRGKKRCLFCSARVLGSLENVVCGLSSPAQVRTLR